MGRKSSADALGKRTAAAAKSSKPSSSSSSFAVGAAGTKRSNLSTSVLLANMDKPKPTDSYTSGMDLPPSDSDDDIDAVMINKPRHRSVADLAVVAPSRKQLKKREMKDQQATRTAGIARQYAIRDDRNAFNVVTLKPDNESPAADAKVKDITIESFSVSARGKEKELLKNASLEVSHGKRYGMVGPNGMGKSTLLKLLAWGKIPVPHNNDVLLVEEEVVGDDRSALEAVVAANEELVLLREEAAAINGTGHDGESGDRLTDVYEDLRLIGSAAAEARASKILAGLGFTTEMQGRATKRFSGGWRMRISLARALVIQPTVKRTGTKFQIDTINYLVGRQRIMRKG